MLAGLVRALTCVDVREGGYAMAADLQAIAIEQRWCRSCPSGNLPLLAQFRGWAVPLDPPAEAGVNWAARRARAGLFTGPVLPDADARTPLLTCGVLVGGQACGCM